MTQHQRYYARHRERRKAEKRAWDAANRERKNAACGAYRAVHREEIDAHNRMRYAETRSKSHE